MSDSAIASTGPILSSIAILLTVANGLWMLFHSLNKPQTDKLLEFKEDQAARSAEVKRGFDDTNGSMRRLETEMRRLEVEMARSGGTELKSYIRELEGRIRTLEHEMQGQGRNLDLGLERIEAVRELFERFLEARDDE
jgi:hypothetical protein